MLLKKFTLIFWLLAPFEQALAATSAWAVKDQVSVRLMSAVDRVGDKKFIPMGLHFKMKPGWKIYWRSPGDAGLPPRISWENLRMWQAPKFNGPLHHDFLYWGSRPRYKQSHCNQCAP